MGYRHDRDEMLAAAMRVALADGLGALTFRRVAHELGASDRMEALVEVYESDIARVRPGMEVRLTSENGGFKGNLSGRVVRISPQVRQRQVLSTDPTGDADARIVEVRVALDPVDAQRVRQLTGLKVIARLQS